MLAQYSGTLPLLVLAGGSGVMLLQIFALKEIDKEIDQESSPFEIANDDNETLRKQRSS